MLPVGVTPPEPAIPVHPPTPRKSDAGMRENVLECIEKLKNLEQLITRPIGGSSVPGIQVLTLAETPCKRKNRNKQQKITMHAARVRRKQT